MILRGKQARLRAGRLSGPTAVAMFLLPFPMTFGEWLILLPSTGPSIKVEVLTDWWMKDFQASAELISSALYTRHLQEIKCNRAMGGGCVGCGSPCPECLHSWALNNLISPCQGRMGLWLREPLVCAVVWRAEPRVAVLEPWVCLKWVQRMEKPCTPIFPLFSDP